MAFEAMNVDEQRRVDATAAAREQLSRGGARR
jgi:hypothetical protein